MKTAFITGGARGIGLEVARALARDGLRVVLGVRDLDKGRKAAAAMGKDVEAVELDVGSEASIAACAGKLRGPLDLLINNAAVYRGVPPEELWPINVRGPILLTRALAAVLAVDANVVNVTSGLGRLAAQPAALRKRLAEPSLTIDDLLAIPPGDYDQSKAVLNAFSRLLAREWPERIVNSVSPGWVKTDMGGLDAPGTIDEGTASVLYCCRLPSGGPSGHVFEDGKDIGF